MALLINASATAVAELRSNKFGKYAAIYDVAAPEQQVVKQIADEKSLPITTKGWLAILKNQVKNSDYQVFKHDAGTYYVVIPNFSGSKRVFDLIIDRDKLSNQDNMIPPVLPDGNLTKTILAAPGNTFLACSGPFMSTLTKLQYAHRTITGVAVRDGVSAWHPVLPRNNQYATISQDRIPNAASWPFTIYAGDSVIRPHLTSLGGLIPMLLDGNIYWPSNIPKPHEAGHVDSAPMTAYQSTYPYWPKSVSKPATSRYIDGIELSGYVYDNKLPDTAGSAFISRSLIAHSIKNDMLLIMVYEDYGLGNRRIEPPFAFFDWQRVLITNDFQDAVFTDGSDSVFLFERKPSRRVKWYVNGVGTSIRKNSRDLPIATKFLIR